MYRNSKTTMISRTANILSKRAFLALVFLFFIFSGLFYSSFVFAQYFSSTSVSTPVGPMTQGGLSQCPDGWYMSGLGRDKSDEDDSTQIYCSPAPSGYSFPSTSNSFSVGNMLRRGTTLCPDGQYMSGLNRRNNSAWEEKQIYCSPAPSGYSFPSTSNSTPTGSFSRGVNNEIDFCPDGSYVSGINRRTNGDWDYVQINCSPAPILPADFGESCDVAPSFRPCGFGYECNSSNVCDFPSLIRPGDTTPSVFPGELNQSCKADGTCNTGLDCVSNVCITSTSTSVVVIPRGGRGQACYSGGTCDRGLDCISGICIVPSCLATEWTGTYQAPGGGAAYGYGTVVDATGNIYVAGESLNDVNAASGLDMFVAKYKPSGILDTSFSTDGSIAYDNNRNESGYGIAIDPANNIYVTGRQDTNNGDIFIRKYDRNGILVNGFGSSGTVVYNGGFADIGKSIAFSSTENAIYVTGYRQNPAGDTDLMLWKYNSSSGAVFSSWPVSYGGAGGNESGNSVALSGANIYVTGWQSTNSGDMILLKFSSAGGNLNQTFDGDGIVTYDLSSITHIGRGVAVSRDGQTVFVTGYQSTNGNDMFLRAYNTTDGSLRWSEEYNSGGQNSDVGRAVVTGNGGRVYLVGSQNINADDVLLNEYFNSTNAGILVGSVLSGTLFQEIGYGATIDSYDQLYVSGYQDLNGGEAFLSKYSCNAPAISGASASGAWASLSIAPGTTGDAPLIITATGAVTIPDPVAYTWDWGDGSPVSTGQIATHTYTNTTCATTCADISRLLTLTVQSPTITSETDTVTAAIIVRSDTAPFANFTVTPSTGVAPLLVRGNAASSADVSPGKIISYSWDWGDGTAPGNGVQTSHVYTNAGDYTITLIVADDGGMPPASASQ